MSPHPVDAEGHEQPDQRQDDGPAAPKQAHMPYFVVERHDDAFERQGQAEQEQHEGDLAASYS